jgi:hypothetical protein
MRFAAGYNKDASVAGNNRALEVVEHPIHDHPGVVYRGLRRTRMLILIILLVLLFGGGFFGYSRYGTGGGMGIGGVVLVILLAWLLLGGGLGNLRM